MLVKLPPRRSSPCPARVEPACRPGSSRRPRRRQTLYFNRRGVGDRGHGDGGHRRFWRKRAPGAYDPFAEMAKLRTVRSALLRSSSSVSTSRSASAVSGAKLIVSANSTGVHVFLRLAAAAEIRKLARGNRVARPLLGTAMNHGNVRNRHNRRGCESLRCGVSVVDAAARGYPLPQAHGGEAVRPYKCTWAGCTFAAARQWSLTSHIARRRIGKSIFNNTPHP